MDWSLVPNSFMLNYNCTKLQMPFLYLEIEGVYYIRQGNTQRQEMPAH